MTRMVEKDLLTKLKLKRVEAIQKGIQLSWKIMETLPRHVGNQGSPNSAGAEITEDPEGQQEGLLEVYQWQKRNKGKCGPPLEWGG